MTMPFPFQVPTKTKIYKAHMPQLLALPVLSLSQSVLVAHHLQFTQSKYLEVQQAPHRIYAKSKFRPDGIIALQRAE